MISMEFIDHDELRLLPTPQGFTEEEVSVEFDPTKFNRRKRVFNWETIRSRRVIAFGVSSLTDETKIDEFWREKKDKNSRLFNQSKFRLSSCKYSINPENLNPRAEIKVGITDYKDMLGTHYSSLANELLEEGRTAISQQNNADTGRQNYIPPIINEFDFTGSTLGIGAITITSDRYVVLMRRASWTGEGAGKIDRPGGHPEPDETLKNMKIKKEYPIESEGTLGCERLKTDKLSPDDYSKYDNFGSIEVRKEIFESVQKELRDEINIAIEDQEPPKLLGEIRLMNHSGRCMLDFLVNLNISKEEVERRYLTGKQLEAEESLHLVFLTVNEIVNWNFDNPDIRKSSCVDGKEEQMSGGTNNEVSLKNIYNEMTGGCKGGLKLLHLYFNYKNTTSLN